MPILGAQKWTPTAIGHGDESVLAAMCDATKSVRPTFTATLERCVTPDGAAVMTLAIAGS
jgi:hypothetical protein